MNMWPSRGDGDERQRWVGAGVSVLIVCHIICVYPSCFKWAFFVGMEPTAGYLHVLASRIMVRNAPKKVFDIW